MMQITVTRSGLLRGLGWTMVAFFWIAFLLLMMFIFNASGDAGYLVMGFFMMVERTLPVLLLPLGIIIYGVRKDHAQPLTKVVFKYGAIAGTVYFISAALIFALLF
jgi:hypothetical protein